MHEGISINFLRLTLHSISNRKISITNLEQSLIQYTLHGIYSLLLSSGFHDEELMMKQII